MEPPDRLEEWTYDNVVEIVERHEFEPARFDFKEVLAPAKAGPEFNLGIRRTVCAMANSGGGFILFGVRDRHHPVTDPRDRIVGIPLGADLLKQFGDKLQGIQAEVHFEAVPRPLVLPTDESRGIFVVRIPESPRRPHMVVSEKIFYRRGDGGSAVGMDYYEVRDQMLLTEERLRKATLLRLELAQYREISAKMFQALDAMSHSVLRFDTSSFKVLLADICPLFPSDETLNRLLAVPTIALTINEMLDLSADPQAWVRIEGKNVNAQGNLRGPLIDDLGLMMKTCTECERELEDLLGPLTATSKV